jgi:hypothetical protein
VTGKRQGISLLRSLFCLVPRMDLQFKGLQRGGERALRISPAVDALAPIADLHSTRAWGMPLSGSYAASLCLCIGLQLASSLIILCAPRVREPVGVIERG